MSGPRPAAKGSGSGLRGRSPGQVGQDASRRRMTGGDPCGAFRLTDIKVCVGVSCECCRNQLLNSGLADMPEPTDGDLPLDIGADPPAGSPGKPSRFKRRYLLVLLIPVIMFSGAVIGMYFQPPLLRAFYGLTGLRSPCRRTSNCRRRWPRPCCPATSSVWPA
jgi:hypothetical protein